MGETCSYIQMKSNEEVLIIAVNIILMHTVC